MLIGGHVFFGFDRLNGALWDANGAVNALVGVDDQHVRAFAKAIDRTDIDTIHEFALNAAFGNNVGHDCGLCVENTILSLVGMI